MRLRRYRPLALLLLTLHLTGCQTWRPTTASPRELIGERQPSSVRVTLASREVIILEEPRLASDSIEGVITDASVDADDGLEAAVAQRDVASMEVRQFSLGRTLALGVIGGAGVIGFAVLFLGNILKRTRS